MPYKKWKELKRLSELDKVKIECRKDKETSDVYRVKFSSLVFEEKEGFCQFFENLLINENLVPLNINWQPQIPTNMTNDMINQILNNPDKLNNILNNSTITASVDTVPTVTSATNVTQGTAYNGNSNTVTSINAVPITYGYTDYSNAISHDIDYLKKAYDDIMNKLNESVDENKETSMNTNDIFNFDFGVISDSKIRMSMYGYAIPNKAGKYVAFDVEHNRIMDVQILNFNCTGMFYKIPKPLTKVGAGDVIFHNGVPMFVVLVDDNRFTVIDPQEGTEKIILPSHSPFGFDYVTCLVSLMDTFDIPADDDNPFGNMLPFILMSNGQTSNQSLPLLMLMNGKMDMDNPMMLLALSGNNNFDMNNPLMVMAMMKMFNK